MDVLAACPECKGGVVLYALLRPTIPLNKFMLLELGCGGCAEQGKMGPFKVGPFDL